MNTLLIISTFLPYPINSGGAQGLFNMINGLRNTYRVILLFPENRDNRMESAKILSKLWPNVVFYPYSFKRQILYLPFILKNTRKLLNRKLNPYKKYSQIHDVLEDRLFSISQDYSFFLRAIIEREKPDLIEVDFYPNINVIKVLPSNIKKIFVHHELRFIVTERFLTPYSLNKNQIKKIEKLKNEEISYLNQYDSVVTVTDIDKDILLKNGVSVPIFSSPSAVNTKTKEYREWNRKLVFVGSFTHNPNHEGMDWFLNSVAPLVDWHKVDGIELIIIGNGWPIEYKKELDGLKINPVGFVEDLTEIAYGGIMIIPILSGSGMRMKILDAAALSMPFVTTSVGVEGLDFRNGLSCIIEDEASEFARSLELLFNDDSLCKSIAINAHETYLKKYSIDASVRKREEIYRDVLNQ